MEEEVEKRLVIDTGSSLVNLPSMAFFFDKWVNLNVREASHKQLMGNAEIQNIKKILGLQHEKKLGLPDNFFRTMHEIAFASTNKPKLLSQISEIVPLNVGNVLGTKDNVAAKKWVSLIDDQYVAAKVICTSQGDTEELLSSYRLHEYRGQVC
ncbi:DNA topoisomerase 2-beta [Triticum urartu]|uniref:DNA topoisomerase 2-beta n=1 Tax=Triticum urartu TaxID=4572 RepID=M7YRC4_TRIUA|nr:DNA topoisomerase 2-beta [Triticum urartu]